MMMIEPRSLPARAGKKICLVWLLCGYLVLGACGITAPRNSEGFAELESLGGTDVDRTITLSIGPTLLRFAARHIEDDPEMAKLLRGLDGVRIRTFEVDGDPARVASRMNQMSLHLRKQGWEPVILLRDEQEEVHLLVKSRNGMIRGLTFLASDGESEAVVINLMGDIQPEQFSDVVMALDIDAPGVRDVRAAGTLN